jgi:hypothetical protein
VVRLVAMKTMRIEINFSALRRTHWTEYAVRFLFGGAVTAITGLIAKRFGPGVAGLFLAFPAIFPAGATLVEKHQRIKKERVGLKGVRRGRAVASVDGAGSAMGSLGLIAFAVIVWRFLPGHSAWLVFAGAGAAWFLISLGIWRLRKTMPVLRRALKAHK